MRYLADLLTLARLILAVALIVMAVTHGSADNAFIIFLVAEFTDIFDGTCARKWPFPKDEVPRYRKYAAFYDMFTDALLAGAHVLFVLLNVNLVAGIVIAVFYLVVCGAVEFLVYGKLFGHPDNCTENSLVSRNFPLAKKIIMLRRWGYVLCLGITNALILFATSWAMPVKIVLFLFVCSIYLFTWFFLRQRRENISRDAVNEEKRLTQKAKKVAQGAKKVATSAVKGAKGAKNMATSAMRGVKKATRMTTGTVGEAKNVAKQTKKQTGREK